MDIYWASMNDSVPFLFFEEPCSLFKEITKTKTTYKSCPSIKSYTEKTFMLTFPIDYNLKIDVENEYVYTDYYDQEFFENFVNIRSLEERLFSFQCQFLFVSESSLKIDLTGAYYSDNSFTRNTTFIPGEFDIGNWVRPVECAFHLRKKVENLEIKRGDPFAYIKFNTDEPINLIKFRITRDMMDMLGSNIHQAKKYNNKHFKLTEWYKLFNQSKSKNAILKEIKENIL